MTAFQIGLRPFYNGPQRGYHAKPALKPQAQRALRFSHGLTTSSAGESLPINPGYLQQVIIWYHTQIKPIQPLVRGDHIKIREHLKIIGDIVGLMPSAQNALQAYQQYEQVFNAVESHEVPRKMYRMYCKQKAGHVGPNQFLVFPYGFYLLVFSPNGAIESFRRVTPPEVDTDAKGVAPNPNLRKQRLDDVDNDYESLKTFIISKSQGGTYPGLHLPVFLADTTRYTRQVFKLGNNGLDAWNQAYTSSSDQVKLHRQFQLVAKQLTAHRELAN